MSLHDFLTSKGLNLKQATIVELLAKGLSDREIAEHLSLSVPVVRRYLFTIHKTLGTMSRAQLIVQCLSFLALDSEAL